MIYLATPYSHSDAAVRDARYHAACRATAQLIQAGHIIFSPIAHSHALAGYGLPTDWAFWEPINREHLVRCDALWVLTLDGWMDSIGVTAEIQIARELGVPVRFVTPETTAALQEDARCPSA